MGDLIRKIWLILVLGLVFGLALAYTDRVTRNRIAENREKQIRELAQRVIVGKVECDKAGAPIFKIKLKELTGLKKKGLWAFEVRGLKSDKLLGYVVIGKGIGWDRLKILIGLSSDLSRIKGIEVVDSRETPGLGARITEGWFKKQFVKPADKPLVLVKRKVSEKYEVQAITGATISSTAVTNIVNRTVKLARELLGR